MAIPALYAMCSNWHLQATKPDMENGQCKEIACNDSRMSSHLFQVLEV